MGLRIDDEHGLNPSLDICFYCQEAMGVNLFGKLDKKTNDAFKEAGLTTGDGEAPRGLVTHKEPCDKCRGLMELGIIAICVSDDSDPQDENPHRLGPWAVLKDDFFERMVSSEPVLASIKQARWAFIPQEAWKALGLPEEKADEINNLPEDKQHLIGRKED
jgi:hypothetical protein